MNRGSLVGFVVLAFPFSLVAACSAAVETSAADPLGDRSTEQPHVEACTTVKRIDFAFQSGKVGGQCLDQAPLATPESSGCVVVAAWNPGDGATCACDPALGRRGVRDSSADALAIAKDSPNVTSSSCFCEIDELVGDEGTACHQDPSDDQARAGFCYVDPALTSDPSAAEVTKDCPEDEARLVRFVGAASALPPGIASEQFTVVCDVACH